MNITFPAEYIEKGVVDVIEGQVKEIKGIPTLLSAAEEPENDVEEDNAP